MIRNAIAYALLVSIVSSVGISIGAAEAPPSPTPKPTAQLALALVTTVKGTTQTLETALSGVPGNADDRVEESFVPGFEPPSFITHETIKVTSPLLGTGTPIVTHSITVGPAATPGNHIYSVEYSFTARPNEFFVAAEAIQVNVLVIAHPVSLNLDAIDFGSTSGGSSKSVQIRNLVQRLLHVVVTPPQGILIAEADAAFDLEPEGSRIIDVTVDNAASGTIEGDLEIQTTDDFDPVQIIDTLAVPVSADLGDGGGGGSALVGDFDNSGRVDFPDFLLFAGAFGSTEAQFDLDDDGKVAFGDFLIFAGQFGKRA